MNKKDLHTILLVEDSAADAEMALDALGEAHLVNPVVHVEDGVECLDYLYARGAWASRDPGDPARGRGRDDPRRGAHPAARAPVRVRGGRAVRARAARGRRHRGRHHFLTNRPARAASL
ncbi:MAG: hypothetical protein ACHP7C_02340, partial [Lysobacterales bacterium]